MNLQKKSKFLKQKINKQKKKQRIKKLFLIFLVKLKIWKRINAKIFLKKKLINYLIFKNCKKINNILDTKYYIRMNIFKKRKNVFLSFSNIFGGSTYNNYSCGHYYKRSLKKTYYAVERLLLKSPILQKKWLISYRLKNRKKKKIWVYMFFKGKLYSKGFKKHLRKFLSIKKKLYKIKFVKSLNFKAHNGIKKTSKRRK